MRRARFTGRRAVAGALLIAVALSAASCRGGDELPQRTLYLSVPLSGPLAQRGRDMVDGARLALDQTNYDTPEVRIALRVIDSARDAAGFARARTDANSLAFVSLGDPRDFTAVTAPGGGGLRSEPRARLLRVVLAPTAGAEGGVAREQVNLLPDARTSGMALAQAVAESAPEVARIATGMSPFDRAVVNGFRDAMKLAGVPVRESRPLGRVHAPLPRAWGDDGVEFVADNPAYADPPAGVQLVTPALAARDFPRFGGRFPKAFEDAYGRLPDRFAVYAYDAVGLALNAITDAGETGEPVTRESTLAAAFALRDRFGPVGHYDVLPNGQTTLYTFGVRPWPLDLEREEEESRAIEVDR